MPVTLFGAILAVFVADACAGERAAPKRVPH